MVALAATAFTAAPGITDGLQARLRGMRFGARRLNLARRTASIAFKSNAQPHGAPVEHTGANAQVR